MAVVDYKVWLLSLIIVTKTSAGAVTSFIPTLVATFKFGKVETLLLVAPPYVFATIVALAVSYSSDKRGERCFQYVFSPSNRSEELSRCSQYLRLSKQLLDSLVVDMQLC